MAEIRFQKLNNSTEPLKTFTTIAPSGLAFFGTTGGSSVAISSYQDSTYVALGDGTGWNEAMPNNKYVAPTVFPSGQVTLGGAFEGNNTTLGLTGIKSMHGTLGIEFGHTTAVNVQNCQLRIYDRDNVNYPATGVNTKVAELINFNGAAGPDGYKTQGTSNVTSNAIGSGDLWWWGEPWSDGAEASTQDYYTNSVGTVFYNGAGTSNRVNGDIRLSTINVAGSYDTVGGTGVIVPLSDSPGSGGKQLQASEVVSGTGMVWPKWTQYAHVNTIQASILGTALGDGSDDTKVNGVSNRDRTYGGTGVDTHHSWSVAISASPLSSGGKEQYGLYVSLEYY